MKYGRHRVTKNLYRMAGSRCANGYLITKKAAQKIWDRGPLIEQYKVIDHVMNDYIWDLALEVYHVKPALLHESSKFETKGFPCPNATRSYVNIQKTIKTHD